MFLSLIVVELLITTNKYRFKASSCLKFNFNRLDLSGLIITSLYIIIASSGCKVKPTKDINYSFPYQEFFFKGQEITNIMLFFFQEKYSIFTKQMSNMYIYFFLNRCSQERVMAHLILILILILNIIEKLKFKFQPISV